MRRAAVASIVVVLGTLALVVVPSRFGGRDPVAHAAALVPFEGCDELRDHLREQARELVGPYGIEGFHGGRVMPLASGFGAVEGREAAGERTLADTGSEAGGGVDAPAAFSTTNVQEVGVDEPDMLKTDGTVVYALVNGAIRSADITGDQPRELDALGLHLGGREIPAEELLLAGDRLFATGSFYDDVPVSHAGVGLFEGGTAGDRGPEVPPEPVEVEPGIVRQPSTPLPMRSVVFTVDVSDPAHLRVVGAMTFEGERVAARLSGGRVRFVLRSQMPRSLRFVSPDPGGVVSSKRLVEEHGAPGVQRELSPEEAERRAARATDLNREIVERSEIEDWLPRFATSEGASGRFEGDGGPFVDCARVHRQPEPSGLGLVSVVTVDPGRDLDPGEPAAVVGEAQLAYASASSLYLAATHWGRPRTLEQPVGVDLRDDMLVAEEPWTSVHRFDLSRAGEAAYRSSGRVAGSVRDQWAFSEHRGHLRVTATEQGQGGEAETSVVVLRESDDRLDQVGSVRGLGRGEQVYAVRYVGDVGFVVTFRQVDPLHVIDLSDPTAPRVAGELEMPGYSSYLHPVGEGRLLGVGADVTEEGQRTGAQLSLFDVRDLARPTRVAHLPLRFSYLPLEGGDHRAFLYWGPRRLVVLPLEVSFTLGESGQSFQGAALFEVGDDGTTLEEVGRIEHPLSLPIVGWPGILRAMVRGDRLLSLSGMGLMSSELDDPTSGRWLEWSRGKGAEAPGPAAATSLGSGPAG